MTTDFIHNPRGEWVMSDSSGALILYKVGDQVSKDGFLYVAIGDTMGHSPEQGERGGWKKLNKSRIMEFVSGATAPSDPNAGDEWFNTTKGNLYKYIDDGDSSQWVSL